jgi:Tol biopolymer transport system component
MVRGPVLIRLGLISLTAFITVTGIRSEDTGHRLANSEGGYHCKWSPDGKQIVFVYRSAAEAKMYVMPACGGEPILVESGLSGDHHTGWSPDSKYLVFDAYGPDGPPPRLWLIPISGGNAAALVPQVAPAFQPALSPDGEWVTFLALRGGRSGIWKAKLNGDSLTRISSDSANYHHPQWSPDGKSIVFASDRSGNWDIWTVNCDGTGIRQITTDSALDDQPMVSPSGRQIAFMSNRSGKRDIWLVPFDGGRAVQFTHGGDNSWPCFSPDGKSLVWSSNRGGESCLYTDSIADN